MLPWRPSGNTFLMTSSELASRKKALYTESPVHPIGDLAAWQSTVVFAPHPDDEALGCGGLIAHLTDRNQTVHVVFVSDGAMSHPNSVKYPRAARIALREQEARDACRVLGVAEDFVHFLRLPDGAVPRRPDEAGQFEAAVRQVAEYLTEWKVDTIVVPWRRDAHPDHQATWAICRSAADRHRTTYRWIEYPVWMWETTQVTDLPEADEMIVWRLPIDTQLARKERAVHAHTSQYAGLIDDDPQGFQLQEGMLDHFRRPFEVFFEEATKRDRSLATDYFDAVYAGSQDPWAFETSPYEQAKYAATLAALPEAQYASGFEIGCSIGVLTAQLAARCDRLLAVDTSDVPLERARRRLANQPSVQFRRMVVPDEFPDDNFDLIVLSEVGYYWSYEDLYRAIDLIQGALRPGGTLMLVHYTPYVPDYPLTGDEVHEAFRERLRGMYRTTQARADRYRLDVWKRKG